MKQTSLEAYQNLQDTGQLGEMQINVYQGFCKYGNHTNLELSTLLRIPINCLVPRTNELVKKGLIEDKFKRKCNVSAKKAIVWGVLE